MIIAQRILTGVTETRKINIPVKFYLPEKLANGDYQCRFEIGWPNGAKKTAAMGVDAVQSLLGAMQMAAALAYTNPMHEKGQLYWLEMGAGYGLPLPKSIRDLSVGDDRDL
jgi:hypothetical protein